MGKALRTHKRRLYKHKHRRRCNKAEADVDLSFYNLTMYTCINGQDHLPSTETA